MNNIFKQNNLNVIVTTDLLKYYVNNIFKQNNLNVIVTTDLLNSDNLKVAIAQLCNELHV